MPISIYEEIVHIIAANISVRLYLLIYNMFHQLTIVMKLSLLFAAAINFLP